MALAPLLDRGPARAAGGRDLPVGLGRAAPRRSTSSSAACAPGSMATPPRRARGGLPPFAFNVVPQIDRFEENGYTREEMKIVWETRKILGLPDLPVTATAVRVPVRVGHAAAVTRCSTARSTPDDARAAVARVPGCRRWSTIRRAARYPTPLACRRPRRGAGRPRCASISPSARGLAFFVASDNLRKGAALNARADRRSAAAREAAARRARVSHAGRVAGGFGARAIAGGLGSVLLGALAGSLVAARFETAAATAARSRWRARSRSRAACAQARAVGMLLLDAGVSARRCSISTWRAAGRSPLAARSWARFRNARGPALRTACWRCRLLGAAIAAHALANLWAARTRGRRIGRAPDAALDAHRRSGR